MAINPSRVKSVVGTGVTALTVTFDESAPLPAGSLLLACAFWTGATDSPTTDWTDAVVTQGGSNGSSNITVFVAKQSDGATNGITVSWPQAQSYARILLVAVPGFVSATPDKTLPANAVSGTSATVGPTAATIGSAFVVSTVGMNAGSSGGWSGAWAGATGLGVDVASDRFSAAWSAQETAGVPQAATRSWITARQTRLNQLAYRVNSVADTTAPVVQITAPVGSEPVSGTVSLEVTATDAVGVAGVSGSISGVGTVGALTRVGTTSTYTRDLDTTTIPDGTYDLTVTAVDAAGNSGSATQSFTVQNTPVVTPIASKLRVNNKGVTSMHIGGKEVIRAYLNSVRVFGVEPPTGGGGTPPVVTPPTGVTTGRFGPDGTHWAPNTPLLTDTFDSTVEVDCTWAAIQTAIAAANASFPNGKVKILVKPGTLVKSNPSSSSAGSLNGVGVARTYNVLVYPRDGWGTVKCDGAAFVNCKGIALFGIDFKLGGIMIRNCDNFWVGRTRTLAPLLTTNGGNGLRNSGYVEVVGGPEARLADTDRCAIRAEGGFHAYNLAMIGCYLAPNYKAMGSSAHCDTIQFSDQSGTTTNGFLIQDTMIFQSADQGIITSNNLKGLTLDNVCILGGISRMELRYPQDSTVDPTTMQNTFWGGTQGIIFRNSIMAGGMAGALGFAEVTNVRSSGPFSGTVASGGFTVDSSLNAPPMDTAQVNEWSPYPDDAYLAAIWD